MQARSPAKRYLPVHCIQKGIMDVIALLGFAALIIVGIALIVLVLKLIWMLVPAAIIAVIVLIITASLWWAGVAFLAVIVLSILIKLFK